MINRNAHETSARRMCPAASRDTDFRYWEDSLEDSSIHHTTASPGTLCTGRSSHPSEFRKSVDCTAPVGQAHRPGGTVDSVWDYSSSLGLRACCWCTDSHVEANLVVDVVEREAVQEDSPTPASESSSMAVLIPVSVIRSVMLRGSIVCWRTPTPHLTNPASMLG
jgi:hypothetical protein